MNITVYCGASLGKNLAIQQATVGLGRWIAESQHNLVYGGSNVGLMGLIADTVLENGGKVIGILPEFLRQREIAHTSLTELIFVGTMTERKQKMFELGDAYIALPGGPGTLEEIIEVISWARIGKNLNPCVFFNADGYYDKLKAFFTHMVSSEFLSQSDFDHFLFSDDLAEIEQFILNYQAPSIRTY